MTIGEFSRATRLSAKALRLYHRAGLLVPASVDPVTSYRYYDVAQIADAQVVRHLRSLSVPVETIARILDAPDVSTRNDLLAAHLVRLEDELDRARTAVDSLRGLLTPVSPRLAVSHRSVPATPALVIRETIGLLDLGEWFTGALAELGRVASAGQRTTGPPGGLWADALFLHERGEAAVFLPVAPTDEGESIQGRVRREILPAADLVVAVHRGPDSTMADTYAALGAHVARHEIAAAGPIRETYLQQAGAGSADVVTEIGWPVLPAASRP
nr:MerR family transcriptional regulator [Nakamurella flavida]